MMKRTRAAALGSILILSMLCMGASNPLNLNSRKELLNRLEKLEKQNAELRQQIADLNTKVEVLTQRINAGGAGAAFTLDDSNFGVTNPDIPGLETVRLRPEIKQPNRPKGRLIVTNSEEEAISMVEHRAPLPGTNYIPLPDPERTLSGADPIPSNSAPAASAPPMAATSSSPSPKREDPQAFNSIKELVDEGKMAEARPLMEEYLGRPGGANEDRVAMMLGSYYFDQGEHTKSIETLKIVTQNHWDNSDLAPEAYYKTGLAYLELGRTEEAGQAFQEIKILYPFSDTAEKAQEMLSSCCP